jgi:ScaI restriction endonuclease
MTSPYSDVLIERWLSVTQVLVDRHPLNPETIVDAVLSSWESIFASQEERRVSTLAKTSFPSLKLWAFCSMN